MTNSSDLLNGLLPFPVSLTTLALIVLAIFAVVAFARGVIRLIFGMIALAVGCVAAYFVYQRAPEFIQSPRGVLIAAIVGGLATYIGARYLIIAILLRPLLGKQRGVVGRVAALISIVPAMFLIWVLATGMRLTGTVMEMEEVGDNVVAEDGQQVDAGWIAHWRSALDNDVLGRLFAKIDPFVEQGKAALVSFLISSRDASAPEEIAAADEDAAEIINSPTMRELQSDPEIRKLVEKGEYVTLLQHPKVREAVRRSDVVGKLKTIDISSCIDKALFSRESNDQPKTRKRIPSRLWRTGPEQAPEQESQ